MTPTPVLTHGNYIGGEWTPAASGAVFENRNIDYSGTLQKAQIDARASIIRWRYETYAGDQPVARRAKP